MTSPQSQLRRNRLNGRWVTISTDRAHRPQSFAPRTLPVETYGSRPCPFCPGNEEETPPALETYGAEGEWLVRVVPNLYPAFAGRPHDELEVYRPGPLFEQAEASGIHEVLVLSPAHDVSWADLDDRQVALVMAAIRDRAEEHARFQGIKYTQVILNYGREAGASVEHPHGQLLGIPFVPHELREEVTRFERHRTDGDGECLMCDLVRAEMANPLRVVFETEKVLVISPFWAGSPYELLVIPRRCTARLHQAPPADVVAVGRAVRDALARIRDRVVDPAYNLAFHTGPVHTDTPFHWHVHIVPKITTHAGFELGTGVLINVVAPEFAAQDLRVVTERPPRDEGR